MLLLVRLIFLSLMFVLISGCSSLSKKDCERGDWKQIGLKDAVKGQRAKPQLKRHESACAKYKIRPNNKDYYLGYSEGLKTFCTRRSGFRFGSDAKEYRDICPASRKWEFLIGYLSGLDLAIDQTISDIDDLQFEKHTKKRRLHSLEDKHKKSEKHKNRVKELRSNISSLRSRISSKRSKLYKLEGWHRLWSQ